MTTRMISTLTCALLLPACPGGGDSTTDETAGTTRDTTAMSDDSTTGQSSGTTVMPDPTAGPMTESLPTTSGASASGTVGEATEGLTTEATDTAATTGDTGVTGAEACAMIGEKTKSCGADPEISELFVAACNDSYTQGEAIDGPECIVALDAFFNCMLGLDCDEIGDPNMPNECVDEDENLQMKCPNIGKDGG